jgi:fructosamine-3-kinase
LIEPVIQHIAKKTAVSITRCEPVRGGDINQCFCLFTADKRYFLKINDAARLPSLFEKEAAGLEALRKSSLIVPAVIQHGIVLNHQWLLLEWLEKSAPTGLSLDDFGAALAGMHAQNQAFFGWHTDNFIGTLPQINTPFNNWADFYTECRIMPLVKILFNKKNFTKRDIELASSFCEKLTAIFPPETPALLHGDLWGGNFMITAAGRAAVFDPAVYYGHREMDIGMSRLFGGFSQAFYDAYHAQYPLQNGWMQRLPVTQLYPVLVHAVLFGGHYIGTALAILKKWG